MTTRMLHFAQKLKSDKLMSDYLQALTSEAADEGCMAMGHGGEKLMPQTTLCLHNPLSLRQQLKAKRAVRKGAAVVAMPHGELSTFMLSHEHWLRKRLLLLPGARQMLKRADAVVALTDEEAKRIGQLAPQTRVVVIPTQIYTSEQTVEDEQAAWAQLARKIDDTRAPLLTSWDEAKAIATLVTAALVQPNDTPHTYPEHIIKLLNTATDEQWRRLLLYAESEGVLGLVATGADRLGIGLPQTDIQHIDRFALRHPKFTEALPSDHTLHPHHALSWRLKSASQEAAPELKALCTLIVNAKMLKEEHRLSLGSVMNVYDYIRHTDFDEDELWRLLGRLRIRRFAKHLLGLIVELTGLEEGYQPMKPKKSRPEWLKPRN